MIIFKIPVFIFILFIFSSCSNSFEMKNIVMDNRFSVDLPDFLSSSGSLNENNSIQYQNKSRNFYVIIIEQPIDGFHEFLEDFYLSEDYSEDLQGYSQLLLDDFEEEADNMEIISGEDTFINGMEAKVVRFTGEMESQSAYFHMGCYKGKNTYYQIVTWVPLSKKEKYDYILSDIIHSFTEI
jgi:hypothetical protein